MRHYSLFFLLALFIPMAQGQNDDIQSANGLPVGQEAPLFSALNQQNQHFSLAEALKQGPVLLVFYRGQWCPFCNRHLSQIQDSLALLKARGLQVIAISPEKPELLRESAQKTGAKFPLIHDKGYAIAQAYGVLFKPEASMLDAYNQKLKADLRQAHSDESQRLPVPATYLISTDGKILWRHFERDYRQRSTVSEILAQIP